MGRVDFRQAETSRLRREVTKLPNKSKYTVDIAIEKVFYMQDANFLVTL